MLSLYHISIYHIIFICCVFLYHLISSENSSLSPAFSERLYEFVPSSLWVSVRMKSKSVWLAAGKPTSGNRSPYTKSYTLLLYLDSKTLKCFLLLLFFAMSLLSHVPHAHLNLLVTQLQQMHKQAQPQKLGMFQSLQRIITAGPLWLCSKTLSLRLLLVIHGVDQGLPAFFGNT